MFTLEAPFPAIEVTSVYPNPEFSDGEGITASVIPRIARDGTFRTYVKTTNLRRRLLWEFHLTRPKAFELKEFYRVYFASKIKVTDHNNRVWVGNIMNNPVEVRADGAGGPDVDVLRGERMSVTLEFEGIEQ